MCVWKIMDPFKWWVLFEKYLNLYPPKQDKNPLNRDQDRTWRLPFQLFCIVTYNGAFWYKIQADSGYFISSFIENVGCICVKGGK